MIAEQRECTVASRGPRTIAADPWKRNGLYEKRPNRYLRVDDWYKLEQHREHSAMEVCQSVLLPLLILSILVLELAG